MDYTSIVCSIISAMAVAVPVIINNKRTNEAMLAEMQKQQALSDQRTELYHNETNEKIDALAAKQDKHNGLIERMVIVEQSDKAMWRKIDEIQKDVQAIKVGGTD